MKKVKRVRIKFKNVITLLLIIIIGIFNIYMILNKKINNIYISGNNILKEQDVLELIGFNDYMKYREIDSKKIEKRLKSSLIVEEVKVKKNLFSLSILLTEYRPMWYQEHDNKLMLSSGEAINLSNKVLGIPVLFKEIDENYKLKFIKELCKIDDDVFKKISEISYEPSDIDQERFLLYMNDKNYVYINLSRMSYLNKYDDLLPKLENKKGILYLDSGNHFEIKQEEKK